MTIHQVQCDFCKAKEWLKYNGEHWLTPKDWRQLYDDDRAHVEDVHICPKCLPKAKKAKQPSKQGEL